MRRIFLGLVLLSAVLAAPLAGCATRTQRLPESGASLEGTVSYGKEKVLVGMVIAQGQGPVGSATGIIGEDGRYHLANVPLGEITLAVNVKAGEGALMGAKMAGKKVPKSTPLPDQYTDPSTSPIKTTIEKGENKFDIVIPK
jgi:hypothetical protein